MWLGQNSERWVDIMFVMTVPFGWGGCMEVRVIHWLFEIAPDTLSFHGFLFGCECRSYPTWHKAYVLFWMSRAWPPVDPTFGRTGGIRGFIKSRERTKKKCRIKGSNNDQSRLGNCSWIYILWFPQRQMISWILSDADGSVRLLDDGVMGVD
jgi:hypothetical protein